MTHILGLGNYVFILSPEPPTVNSEIFARILFSRNFANAKFREIETLAKWQNQSVVY